MENPKRILDPNGDVLIVLKNPYPTFALWPGTWRSGNEDRLGAAETVPYDFEFLASKAHLAHHSRYFRTLLSGRWRHEEAIPGVVMTEVRGLDEEALTTVLQIMHHHPNPGLGSNMTIEMLAKIALVADYFQCQEAVSYVVKSWKWLPELTDPLWASQEITRDIVLWLFTATVLRMEEDFSSSARLAMEVSIGPIPTLGLPIPEKLVSDLERRRSIATKDVLEKIILTGRDLRDGKLGCNPACASALLKAFENQFDIEDIIKKKPFWTGCFTFRELDVCASYLYPPCDRLYADRRRDELEEGMYESSIFEAHRALDVSLWEFFPKPAREWNKPERGSEWAGVTKIGEEYYVDW